jgi:hypothetical protein
MFYYNWNLFASGRCFVELCQGCRTGMCFATNAIFNSDTNINIGA